jgi:hypothetical protein
MMRRTWRCVRGWMRNRTLAAISAAQFGLFGEAIEEAS